MKPQRTTLTLAAADDDGICQTQNPANNAALTINGALASGGVATMDVARRVRITSAADDTLVTFTISGTNRYGITISEALAGANATTKDSVKDYKTVTSITTSGNAGSLTVGTSAVASSAWQSLCHYADPGGVALGCIISPGGAMTYTVEHTFDDIQDLDAVMTGTITALPHEDLVAKTVSADGNYAFIPVATRVTTSAYTSGTLTFTAIQQG